MSAPNATSATIAAIEDAVRRRDTVSLMKYASIAESGGNLGVAAMLLQRAMTIKPSPEVAIALALTLEKAGRDSEALPIYENFLRANPDRRLYVKAAEVAGRLGEHETARRHYLSALALDPSDVKTAFALSDQSWDAGLAEAAAALKMAADAPSASHESRARLLARYVVQRELEERQKRGLPLHHAISMAEFPFAFATESFPELSQATDRWLQDGPAPEGLLYKVALRLTESDFAGADAIMKEMQRIYPQQPKATMRFVKPDLKPMGLPKVATLARAKPGDSGAVFLSCDDEYLSLMAAPLLVSLRRKAPKVGVRLHVMTSDPTKALKVVNRFDDLRITLTHENPQAFIAAHIPQPAQYYGSVRFVRFHEALRSSAEPLCMLDVDGLVNSDLSRLFAIEEDVAFRARAGRMEPWNLFSACLVMGRPTARARAYYKEIADIIAGSIDHLWWGIDQYAMFAAYAFMKSRNSLPSIRLLGPEHADVDAYSQESSVWFTAGSAKSKMNMPERFPPGTPRRRYAEAFSAYLGEARVLLA